MTVHFLKIDFCLIDKIINLFVNWIFHSQRLCVVVSLIGKMKDTFSRRWPCYTSRPVLFSHNIIKQNASEMLKITFFYIPYQGSPIF